MAVYSTVDRQSADYMWAWLNPSYLPYLPSLPTLPTFPTFQICSKHPSLGCSTSESLRWKNRERKEGGRVLHAVYSVTCGEFPTRNIILPYNSNYAAHRLIKWYWNNSVMSLKRYKSKYMRQNVLNYTFFFKRILEAMRKLYISLLVVESKFGCKNKKV